MYLYGCDEDPDAPACGPRASRDETPILVHVTPHTFRRTYTSFLVAAGYDLPYVQAQVGHRDPRTTLAIYARVMARQTATSSAAKSSSSVEPTVSRTRPRARCAFKLARRRRKQPVYEPLILGLAQGGEEPGLILRRFEPVTLPGLVNRHGNVLGIADTQLAETGRHHASVLSDELVDQIRRGPEQMRLLTCPGARVKASAGVCCR
jgi:hypothetical protein